jgi:hypothetical protein
LFLLLLFDIPLELFLLLLVLLSSPATGGIGVSTYYGNQNEDGYDDDQKFPPPRQPAICAELVARASIIVSRLVLRS